MRKWVGPYINKPKRLLMQLSSSEAVNPHTGSYCAGFEVEIWRCNAFADHLIEWIADYALKEDELRVNHTNMYIRLKEAASRVYRSDNYSRRGEIGEITLHAICRDYFNTIPFAPRVFYLTSSNDVVKSFDMVHVRYLGDAHFELWLGEAKLYEDGEEAMKAAIKSVEHHIDQGFLNNEKLLLGPQVSREIPQYQEIRDLLSVQTSLDELFKTAVFPICIACNSPATAGSKALTDGYVKRVAEELALLADKLQNSGLQQTAGQLGQA